MRYCWLKFRHHTLARFVKKSARYIFSMHCPIPFHWLAWQSYTFQYVFLPLSAFAHYIWLSVYLRAQSCMMDIKSSLYLLGPPLHNYQSTVLLCMFVHAVIPVAYIVEPYIVSNTMCNLMVIHTLYIQFIQSMWLAQWSLSRSKYIHKPNNNSGNWSHMSNSLYTSSGVQELSFWSSPLSVNTPTGEPSATVLTCTRNPRNSSPPDPDRVTAQNIEYWI